MKLFSGIFIICTLVTEASALTCFKCEHSTTGNCGQNQVACDPALNHKCSTTSITETIDGKTQSVFRDTCGTCIGTLSFSNGEFSVHVVDRCCQTDLCNNQAFTEEANSTLNGLECYGCPVIVNQTCEDPKETVKCVGEQTWCLHTKATFGMQEEFTMKGCASEIICKNPEVFNQYHVNPKQEFYCCKGSGCNRRRLSPNDSPAVQQGLTLLTLSLIALIPCLI